MLSLLVTSFCFYLLSYGLHLVGRFKTIKFGELDLIDWSKYVLTVGLALHTGALLFRTYSTGHAPMADMFETIMLYSFTVVLATVIIIFRYKERTVELISMPVAMVALVVSILAISPGKPLSLVLRTWYFETHVMSSFAAYAFFTVAFSSAVLYLIIERNSSDGIRIDTFQEIMGRSIMWGFFLFSISMFLAAIWSYLAWGSYWLWDAKVIWSFIVWFYYGGAIHAWFVKGWRGRAFAIGSIIGFFVVLFTYLGVSLLMKSTHSF